MYSILLVLIQLIYFSLSNEDLNCYFTVKYSNGSTYRCLDEECSIDHIDIISLEANQCRTNYLSLKYSSYSSYSKFLVSNPSYLSSYFSLARPNLERLLQIEFLSPLENNSPFEINELSLLTNSTSNIDTYELIFHGNISKTNSIIFISKDLFLNNKQEFIDTLRLIFNCTNEQRVEWELVKSISSLPESPCPQQIQYFETNHSPCFNINILVRKFILLIKSNLFFLDKSYWIDMYSNSYCNKFIIMELSSSNSSIN